MKILVTGHNGYIGSHLIELLHKEGYETIGVDVNLYKGCEWDNYEKPNTEIIKDIRSLELNDFVGVDCVIHLAALSNDPMGELNADLTYDINRRGSIHLAKLAKEAGVSRFLFSSSCSIYGKGEKLDLNENDLTNPVSAYAISKIDSENAIMEIADNNFTPVFLRNATAYGYSPMLRIDLVVNNLLGCAVANGDIQIHSDGTPWRPLIHCRDIARAFIAFVKAPKEIIHNQIVNIGDNSENYQVKDISNLVKLFCPNANIIFTGQIGEDPRNYRVDFTKLYQILPDFKLSYNLENGMKELYNAFISHNFSKFDFNGDQFVRLRTLKKNLKLII